MRNKKRKPDGTLTAYPTMLKFGKHLGKGSYNTVTGSKMHYSINVSGPVQLPFAVRAARGDIKPRGRSTSKDIIAQYKISTSHHPGLLTHYKKTSRHVITERARTGTLDALAKSADIIHLKRAFFQLLHTLGHYHNDLRIAHRDIKPENIVITDEGIAKLIDDDFAICLENESWKHDSHLSGSPGYMPPELFLSNLKNGYDFRAHDAWALGMTMLDSLNLCLHRQDIGSEYFNRLDALLKCRNLQNIKALRDYDITQEPVYQNQNHEIRAFVDVMRLLLEKDPVQRIVNLNTIQYHPFFAQCNHVLPLMGNHILFGAPPTLPNAKESLATYIADQTRLYKTTKSFLKAYPHNALYRLKKNVHATQLRRSEFKLARILQTNTPEELPQDDLAQARDFERYLIDTWMKSKNIEFLSGLQPEAKKGKSSYNTYEFDQNAPSTSLTFFKEVADEPEVDIAKTLPTRTEFVTQCGIENFDINQHHALKQIAALLSMIKSSNAPEMQHDLMRDCLTLCETELAFGPTCHSLNNLCQTLHNGLK